MAAKERKPYVVDAYGTRHAPLCDVIADEHADCSCYACNVCEGHGQYGDEGGEMMDCLDCGNDERRTHPGPRGRLP